jgi:hypothetical protein
MLLPLIASGAIALGAAPAKPPGHFLLSCAGDNYSHHSGKDDFERRPWSMTYDVDLKSGTFFATSLRKTLKIDAVRTGEIDLLDRGSDVALNTLIYYEDAGVLVGRTLVGSPQTGYFTVETQAHCTISPAPG